MATEGRRSRAYSQEVIEMTNLNQLDSSPSQPSSLGIKRGVHPKLPARDRLDLVRPALGYHVPPQAYCPLGNPQRPGDSGLGAEMRDHGSFKHRGAMYSMENSHVKDDELPRDASADLDTMAGRIRALRIARGLTQQDLAKACEVTKGAVSQWENRTVINIRPPTLMYLCEALGTDPQYLIFGPRRTWRSATGRR